MCRSCRLWYDLLYERMMDAVDAMDAELLAEIGALVKQANQRWDEVYARVPSQQKTARRVAFSSAPPSVLVLRVWDFAARKARAGDWECVGRDRQRFADRCQRIDADIGHVFAAQHRQRVFSERFGDL